MHEKGDKNPNSAVSRNPKDTYKGDQTKYYIKESDYLGFKNISNTNHLNFTFKEKFKKILEPCINKNFSQNNFDFAKTIQSIVEDAGVKLSEWSFEKTKKNKICLSGGVALNGLMNNKILNLNCFKDALHTQLLEMMELLLALFYII